MSLGAEVNADLMCPARKNFAPQKRISLPVTFDLFPIGPRLAPFSFIDNTHFISMNRMAPDRCANGTRQQLGGTSYDRKIFPLDLPIGKNARQCRVSLIGLRRKNHTGGFAIEPMNNPGPIISTDSTQLPVAMSQQSMDQRIVLRPGTRMNDHPTRFIYRDKMLILKKDFQRDGNRTEFFGTGFRHSKLERVPFFDTRIFRQRNSVPPHFARIENTLNGRTAQFRQNIGKILIRTFPSR